MEVANSCGAWPPEGLRPVQADDAEKEEIHEAGMDSEEDRDSYETREPGEGQEAGLEGMENHEDPSQPAGLRQRRPMQSGDSAAGAAPLLVPSEPATGGGASTEKAPAARRQRRCQPKVICVVVSAVMRILWPVLVFFGRRLWKAWVGHKRRVILSDWEELEFAPAELQQERETVLAAVKQDWKALEFAAQALRSDREIVHEAVTQSWRALRFASKGLRADRELVLCAVRKSNGWALEFAAEALYQDPDLVREATSRLGGRLGLPLAPITTLVDDGFQSPGDVVPGPAAQPDATGSPGEDGAEGGGGAEGRAVDEAAAEEGSPPEGEEVHTGAALSPTADALVDAADVAGEVVPFATPSLVEERLAGVVRSHAAESAAEFVQNVVAAAAMPTSVEAAAGLALLTAADTAAEDAGDATAATTRSSAEDAIEVLMEMGDGLVVDLDDSGLAMDEADLDESGVFEEDDTEECLLEDILGACRVFAEHLLEEEAGADFDVDWKGEVDEDDLGAVPTASSTSPPSPHES
mmetsp:Transcript_91114/g.294331  ORF Transcript_91114/g.294331 Transcript_91114/m.294331 type:complete len:524 (+) Transcript_91114:232-1803(+)